MLAPPASPAHELLFTNALESGTRGAGTTTRGHCRAGEEGSNLLSPSSPRSYATRAPSQTRGQGSIASPLPCPAAISLGVIGEPKELDSARLPAAVVFAIFVVAGEGQQRPLRVPGHCEGGGLALHLPELLSCTEKAPRQRSPALHAAPWRAAGPSTCLLPPTQGSGGANAASAPFNHLVTRLRHDTQIYEGLARQRLPLLALCCAHQAPAVPSQLHQRFSTRFPPYCSQKLSRYLSPPPQCQ